MFGKIKTMVTIQKLIKPVHVYDSTTKEYLGEYSTVNCSKQFNMGKDTLTKYIKKGLPFKGKLFSRKKLH
jgi:hypothetical protein